MKKRKGYPLPLGVTVREDEVCFSVAVESGKTCHLCFYKENKQKPEVKLELLEEDAVGEVRYIAVDKSEVPSSDEVLGKFRRFKFLDFQNLIPHNHKTLCFQ